MQHPHKSEALLKPPPAQDGLERGRTPSVQQTSLGVCRTSYEGHDWASSPTWSYIACHHLNSKLKTRKLRFTMGWRKTILHEATVHREPIKIGGSPVAPNGRQRRRRQRRPCQARSGSAAVASDLCGCRHGLSELSVRSGSFHLGGFASEYGCGIVKLRPASPAVANAGTGGKTLELYPGP